MTFSSSDENAIFQLYQQCFGLVFWHSPFLSLEALTSGLVCPRDFLFSSLWLSSLSASHGLTMLMKVL